MTQPRGSGESWSTRVGVILAVTGSAVGLGNFLRFPGLAAQYEGGAFMIPYAVAFLVLGLPIAWVEWSLGRYGGRHGFNSTPGVYYAVCKNRFAPYMGVLGLIVPVMIYMFYVFIEAWCLGYAWYYLTGRMASEAQAGPIQNFINGFVGIESNGALFDRPWDSSLLFLMICFALNFILIWRGLQKGIEWFCKWAMPALVLCALIVLVRVLTLPANPQVPDQNVINGLGFMWNPSSPDKSLLASLANAEIWLAAAGQIFFSLSVGFGIIITYASYLKKDDDVALSSLTAAAGNGFCEVSLGGLILIPATFVFLGAISQQQLDSSFQLGFKVLPMVFEQMPGGRFFGFLFFFLLFLAAVTSSLSMLQPAIAFLEEGLGIGRRASVAILGFVTALGAGFVVFFSAGLGALDALDFWIATFCIYILATIQVILYGWVLGVDKGFEELDHGAELRVPRFVKFIIKFIAPLYLLTIFGVWVYQKLPGRLANISTVEGITLAFIGVTLLTFILLVSEAVRRWEKQRIAQEEVSP